MQLPIRSLLFLSCFYAHTIQAQNVSASILSAKNNSSEPTTLHVRMAIRNNTTDTIYIRPADISNVYTSYIFGSSPVHDNLLITGFTAKVIDDEPVYGFHIKKRPAKYFKSTSKFLKKYKVGKAHIVSKKRLADRLNDTLAYRILTGHSLTLPLVMYTQQLDHKTIVLDGNPITAQAALELRYFRNSSVIMSIDTIVTAPSGELKKALLPKRILLREKQGR